MQVTTFVIDPRAQSGGYADIEELYNDTEFDTKCLLSILEAEADAITTVLEGESVWSSPLLSLILARHDLDQSSPPEEVQSYISDKLTSTICERYRFVLSMQQTLLGEDSLYRGVRCHMITDEKGGYKGHFLTYKHREGVTGSRDLYLSVTSVFDCVEIRLLQMSVEHLISSSGEDSIVVETIDPFFKKALRNIESRCEGEEEPESEDEDK